MKVNKVTSYPRDSHRCSGGDVIRWILPVVNFLAVLLSIFAIFSCNFFSYRFVDEDYLIKKTVNIFLFQRNEAFEFQTISVGLFGASPDSMFCADFRYFDSLMSENNNPLGFYLIAQFCSMIAPAFGLLAFMMTLIGLCCRLQIGWKIMMSLMYLLATLFQIGTFSASFRRPEYDNEYDNGIKSCLSNGIYSGIVSCEMDSGAWLSVTSMVLYFLLTFLTCCTPRPLPKEGDVENGQDTEMTNEQDIEKNSDETARDSGESVDEAANDTTAVDAVADVEEKNFEPDIEESVGEIPNNTAVMDATEYNAKRDIEESGAETNNNSDTVGEEKKDESVDKKKNNVESEKQEEADGPVLPFSNLCQMTC